MNDFKDSLRLDEIGFGSLKIYQDPSDFCYGVDAVILSDFASETGGDRIIDLGTGNGIIPLIMSHKTKAGHITGIELRKNAADLAQKNIQINALENRISIINCDVKELSFKEEFDAVITNPPYIASGRGIINGQNPSKMTARHETTANLKDFAETSESLLKDKGELYMVHRPSRTVEIINSLSSNNLEPKIIRYVSPRQGTRPNIMLIKAIKNGGSEVEIREPLYVYNSDGSYTDEIMAMYERI